MAAAPLPGLPTGTVTFMFTDIEGSTRLLAELGERYDRLLTRHSGILGTALADHQGVAVSTEGDAVFAAFRSAPEAVAAAAQAQQALAAERWPEGIEIKVRMGLHTGEGRLGGDNYSGLDVNRAARIAAAGHGGQVLLSDATRGLVANDLPAGVGLRDLGQHRLKDLPAAEHIWQLDIPGLRQDFPALRSLDARPNNLPLAPTSLIGREEQLREVTELLRETRLLTFTGPGGTGKTRLALAAAQQLLPQFTDGVFFVALQDAHDAADFMTAVASALGVREKPDRSIEQGVKQFLRERELLLVLDNFEQLVEAAPLVAELLAGSAQLRIIVTSRALLRVSGEQGYGVPPLRLPDPQHLPQLSTLSQYEAVALFIARARAVKSDFFITNENAPAVAEICSRLDGLPLAIELAAARARVLAPQAILARLERRLPLLTGGSQDVPDRQRTLRGAIDWSYGLLDEADRRLFARLAVFAGGWTLEAAEEICNPVAELGRDTLDGLTSLSDKSLISPAADDGGEARFVMLQVIREFAAEQLDASGEAGTIRARHAGHMLTLAEEAEPHLLRSDVRRWQRRLRREEENLRTALRWAISTGEAETGLRIAGALWRYWQYWAQLREGRQWLESMLALSRAAAPSIGRARALSGLAGLRYWQGEESRALYEEALAIRRQLGDDQLVAQELYNTAWAALTGGDIPLAMERAREALELFRLVGDRGGSVTVSAWLTTMPFFMGAGGNLDDALAAAREAIAVNRELGLTYDAADWSGGIAQSYYVAGDFARATEAVRDALRGFIEMGNVGLYPMTLHAMAALELASQGAPERAVRLAAAAQRYFDEIGGQLHLAARFGDPLEEARPLLGGEEYARALEAGRAMELDEAVAYALEQDEATARPDQGQDVAAAPTQRT